VVLGSIVGHWLWSLSFVMVVPPSFVGGSPLRSSWVVPPRSFIVVVPPSFAVGGHPSFVVGVPCSFVVVVPLVRRVWSSPSVHCRWSPIIRSLPRLFVMEVPPSFVVGCIPSFIRRWQSLHSFVVVPLIRHACCLFVVEVSRSFVVGCPPSFIRRGPPHSSWVVLPLFIAPGHHRVMLWPLAPTIHPRAVAHGAGDGAGLFRCYGSAWGCCCR
jgi:hypothetical protein